MIRINQVNTFKTIFNVISRRRKYQLIILSLLTFLSSFLEVFSIGAIFPFVSVFLDPLIILNNEYVKPILVYLEISKPVEIYFPVTFGFFILTTISYSLKSLLVYLRSKLSRIINFEVSTLIYWKIINESYQFHTNQNSGDSLAGINFSFTIAGSFLIPILKAINSTLILFFAFIGILILNPLIGVSILGFLFVFYFTIGIMTNKILKSISFTQNENYSKIFKLVKESLGAIKMIILNKSQSFYLKNYNRIIRDYLMTISKAEYISQLPKLFFEYIIIILIIVLTFTFKEKENITVIFPLFITFVLAFQKLLPEANILYDSITRLKTKKAIIERVISYLKINQKSPFKQEDKIPPINFKNKIQLKNLNFNYEKDNKLILSDINLSINKGQCLGIVGKTGSGKSTLIDIISGLISPTSGQILVDNVILEPKNIEGWKQKISLVSQNIFLFDSTIEENIAFNPMEKNINYEKLHEVCKIVQLNDFIENQQKGFQSIVGENGVRISGGQIQRIGIARALYNSSEILILDEATSALDEQTESIVMKNIIEYSNNLTLIIIAHRLTTLKYCNKIVKVESKGLIEFDGYKSLIKKIKT